MVKFRKIAKSLLEEFRNSEEGDKWANSQAAYSKKGAEEFVNSVDPSGVPSHELGGREYGLLGLGTGMPD